MAREVALFSPSRALILSIVEKYEPLSKEDISKKTGLSRASIYHHLDELKKRGLVHEKIDKKKLGHPIFISTEKAYSKDGTSTIINYSSEKKLTEF